MAFWQARDFLFCGVCGTLLSFNSVHSASCPLCGFKRKASEIEGKETRYTITDEDIRRELKLKPFVIVESAPQEVAPVQGPEVNETCPKCLHPRAEYFNLQTRSADEGQTIFYKCLKCNYRSKRDN